MFHDWKDAYRPEHRSDRLSDGPQTLLWLEWLQYMGAELAAVIPVQCGPYSLSLTVLDGPS